MENPSKQVNDDKIQPELSLEEIKVNIEDS